MDSTPHPDDDPLDAEASLALIRDQQEHVRATREPDARLIFGAWAISWLVGFLLLWKSSTRTGALWTQPTAAAYGVFAALMAASVAFSIVHTVRRSAGTRGPSARVGALYGWSWTIGFLAMTLIMNGLSRAGASDQMLALAANALVCVIVGLLYLAGALVFGETSMYALGVWILVVAGAATIVGLPTSNLVMALAGGGGFLIMAVAAHVRLVRRRRRATTGA